MTTLTREDVFVTTKKVFLDKLQPVQSTLKRVFGVKEEATTALQQRVTINVPANGNVTINNHFHIYIESPKSEVVEDITPYIMTSQEREELIREFEQTFNMTSEQFLKLEEEGNAPESFDARYWSILLRHT